MARQHSAAASAFGLLLAAVLIAGCGLKDEAGSTEVRVTVTRGFGAIRVGELVTENATGADTAFALLQRHFPDAAEPGAGLLYVNGILAPKVEHSPHVHPGDRVWWDLTGRGTAIRPPAVVGSYPEPFRHGSGGKRAPVRVECAAGVDAACTQVLDGLGAAGVPAGRGGLGTGVGKSTLRVLVGPWSELSGDAAAARLAAGPAVGGVFARFRGPRLELLDRRGRTTRTVGPGAGLVAATVFEEQLPTWLVTGGSVAGVNAAAGAFDERSLRNRFALVVNGEERLAAPTR